MSCELSSIFVILVSLGAPAVYGQSKPDFSRFLVAGDSLGAGYQNAQLIESGQTHGYANVVATQLGVSLNLPLIPAPGYPQISTEAGFALDSGLMPIGRLNTQQTLNVAVPGLPLAAFVGLPATCPPDYTNAVAVMAAEILNPTCSLNPAPTELQEAAALKPTTSILWIGSNDALYTILFGNDPTDLPTFTGLYHIAATTMAQASGHLVLANIPDVTLVPYVTSVPKLAAILGLPVATVEAIYGLNAGDMVTPYAFLAIQAMGNMPGPLPDSSPNGPVVVRAARLAQIRAAVAEYNSVIAAEAAANHAALVDINALVTNLAANGIQVGGQRLTTDFMGGLFSLDGVHPTNTGYAIIANEFIKAMNRAWNIDIEAVSIEQVSKTDPLLPTQGDDKKNKESHHVTGSMAGTLRSMHN
ncbi:MAG: SGNH/GDSL hydrolase family protein [Candidatus Sulfopaludibacter sp.]|nr:SGNH/GDSL hydrolase family protein [Candidatus Sulfopaludibacter sp.]